MTVASSAPSEALSLETSLLKYALAAVWTP